MASIDGARKRKEQRCGGSSKNLKFTLELSSYSPTEQSYRVNGVVGCL
jgi:hypothetical protein